VVELKAWVVVWVVVDRYTNTSLDELRLDLVSFVAESLVVAVFVEDWDDYDLDLGHSGRQDKAVVVRVDHDHRTD